MMNEANQDPNHNNNHNHNDSKVKNIRVMLRMIVCSGVLLALLLIRIETVSAENNGNNDNDFLANANSFMRDFARQLSEQSGNSTLSLTPESLLSRARERLLTRVDQLSGLLGSVNQEMATQTLSVLDRLTDRLNTRLDQAGTSELGTRGLTQLRSALESIRSTVKRISGVNGKGEVSKSDVKELQNSLGDLLKTNQSPGTRGKASAADQQLRVQTLAELEQALKQMMDEQQQKKGAKKG